MATEKEKENTQKVKLNNKYSFGDEVEVCRITLGDEETIEKKMISNNGAGEKLFTIALCCGLDINEARDISRADGNLIVEAIQAFQ